LYIYPIAQRAAAQHVLKQYGCQGSPADATLAHKHDLRLSIQKKKQQQQHQQQQQRQ
jgi:hypothetical protein